jgi:hypothetical protein
MKTIQSAMKLSQIRRRIWLCLRDMILLFEMDLQRTRAKLLDLALSTGKNKTLNLRFIVPLLRGTTLLYILCFSKHYSGKSFEMISTFLK